MALLCLSPPSHTHSTGYPPRKQRSYYLQIQTCRKQLSDFDFLKFRSMYTDADKHLKDFNTLNQYQQEEEQEEDIWGEEQETEEIQKWTKKKFS